MRVEAWASYDITGNKFTELTLQQEVRPHLRVDLARRIFQMILQINPQI